MNMVKAKRIRHFLRLTYPLRVVADARGFRAEYPDLPGCALEDGNLTRLYASLELMRRQWITERVLTDAEIPLPNSHLLGDASQADDAEGLALGAGA